MSASRLVAILAASAIAARAAADGAGDRVAAAPPRMPPGIDVSPADPQLYAMVMMQASAGGARARVDASVPETAPGPADDGSCTLTRPGSQSLPTQDCVRCHRGDHATSHPVDIDYGRASGRPAMMLRSAAEVVKRGLLLPDGKLHCVTCHDGMSRWKSHLVVPPGSEIRLAIDRENPATFDAQGVAWAARATLPPGTDVARKALCTACHAMD